METQLGMNNFQRFLALTEPLKAENPEALFEVSEPALRSGFWILTVDTQDGYSIEVEWKNALGFGVIAGADLLFGEGVHEIYASPEDMFERVRSLLASRVETCAAMSISLADLRKLRGQMQKEVAEVMGITKGGLAQIEASAAQGKVQVDTLQRLISSLGGRLLISAAFPDGTERRVSIGS